MHVGRGIPSQRSRDLARIPFHVRDAADEDRANGEAQPHGLALAAGRGLRRAVACAAALNAARWRGGIAANSADSRDSLREKLTSSPLARLLDEHIPVNARILDAGCGTGALLRAATT